MAAVALKRQEEEQFDSELFYSLVNQAYKQIAWANIDFIISYRSTWS
jgi:hypothetical protein